MAYLIYLSVVTNPHKASQALDKVVAEMERRYDLFNILQQEISKDIISIFVNKMKELEKQSELPYIVVIVDELADLMMVAGKS